MPKNRFYNAIDTAYFHNRKTDNKIMRTPEFINNNEREGWDAKIAGKLLKENPYEHADMYFIASRYKHHSWIHGWLLAFKAEIDEYFLDWDYSEGVEKNVLDHGFVNQKDYDDLECDIKANDDEKLAEIDELYTRLVKIEAELSDEKLKNNNVSGT